MLPRGWDLQERVLSLFGLPLGPLEGSERNRRIVHLLFLKQLARLESAMRVWRANPHIPLRHQGLRVLPIATLLANYRCRLRVWPISQHSNNDDPSPFPCRLAARPPVPKILFGLRQVRISKPGH